MNQLKNQIRAIIATAHHSKCASFSKCNKCKGRCGAFIPSAKLYEEIKQVTRKAVN